MHPEDGGGSNNRILTKNDTIYWYYANKLTVWVIRLRIFFQDPTPPPPHCDPKIKISILKCLCNYYNLPLYVDFYFDTKNKL